MSLEINLHPILDIERKFKMIFAFVSLPTCGNSVTRKRTRITIRSRVVRSVRFCREPPPLLWGERLWVIFYQRACTSSLPSGCWCALPCLNLCALFIACVCGRSQRQQRDEDSDMSDLNKRLDQKSGEDGEDDAGNQFEKDAVEPDVDVV